MTIKITTLLISLCVFFSLAFIGVGQEQTYPKFDIGVDSRYFPGNKISTSCGYNSSYRPSGKYTTCISPNGVFSLYELSTGVIIYSTFIVNDKTVANFILAWGKPSGYRYDSDRKIVYIYWGDAYIWTIGKHFSPDSKIYYLTYSSEPVKLQSWRGFIVIN